MWILVGFKGYEHPETYRTEDDKTVRVPTIGGFKGEVTPEWMKLKLFKKLPTSYPPE